MIVFMPYTQGEPSFAHFFSGEMGSFLPGDIQVHNKLDNP